MSGQFRTIAMFYAMFSIFTNVSPLLLCGVIIRNDSAHGPRRLKVNSFDSVKNHLTVSIVCVNRIGFRETKSVRRA